MRGLRQFLFFLPIICLSVTFSGESPRRNILVIPFGRFDFHTEIEMKEINKINGSSGEEFYNQVYAGMCEAFMLHNGEQVAFKVAEEEDKALFRSAARFGMKENVNHYTCFPENLSKSDMKKLLDEYDCDYLLTVNWYRILESRTSLKSGKVKLIRVYTSHMIDCDLFTRECTNIMEHTGKKYEVIPTEDNIEKKGLLTGDMKNLYHQMVGEVAGCIADLGDKW